MNQVISSLKNQAKEKGLELVNWCAEKTMIKADEDKVREVLVNLIGNALKFTEKGKVAVSVWKQNSNIVFAVEDTGHGIREEDKNKLFQKFIRVGSDDKDKGKSGTGLGLYICKTLLEGMGGAIWFESLLNKGTTFYFTLPIFS
jgi:signal transduction histidine kinase